MPTRHLAALGLLACFAACGALAGCAQGTPPERDAASPRDVGIDARVSLDAPFGTDVGADAASVPDAGGCSPGCMEPQECCSGGCVDTTANPNHCGRCGNRCMMGTLCSAGTCGGPTCTPACDTGETCMGGACRCGTGAACTGTNSCCGGTCVDTQTNVSHCGGCGRACAMGERCSAGRCMSTAPCGGTCPSGQMCCDDVCTRTDTVANCGACGRVCGADQMCCAGTACVSTQTDRNNCGGCGATCGMRGDGCAAGSCTCGGMPACILACTFGMCPFG